MTNSEWIEIKKNVRGIRKVCHRLRPTEDGIRCFHEVDELQDELRKIFQERRRRGR